LVHSPVGGDGVFSAQLFCTLPYSISLLTRGLGILVRFVLRSIVLGRIPAITKSFYSKTRESLIPLVGTIESFTSIIVACSINGMEWGLESSTTNKMDSWLASW
jgi:hypothetical protein